MPHAEAGLSIPWGVISFLLSVTGAYGYWAVTRVMLMVFGSESLSCPNYTSWQLIFDITCPSNLKQGNTWHHRQFVSASWGFLLMLLCWAIVYIAVEEYHVDKVNTGCMNSNPSWTLQKCDVYRKKAAMVSSIMTTIGMVLSLYLTLVLSRWVTAAPLDQGFPQRNNE